MAKSNAERQADFRKRRDALAKQALRNAAQTADGKAATLDQLRVVWEKLSAEDRAKFIDAFNAQQLDHEQDMHELATRNVLMERQLAEAQAALKKSRRITTEATEEVLELRRQVDAFAEELALRDTLDRAKLTVDQRDELAGRLGVLMAKRRKKKAG